MLDDREQRVLDATEALLGREEPELAARLRHHSMAEPRQLRTRSRPGARRVLGVSSAGWLLLLMVGFCLAVLVLPALLL